MQGLREILTRPVAAGMIGGAIGAVIVSLLLIVGLWQSGLFQAQAEEGDDIPGGLPGQAAIANFTCGQGETRLVVMHGKEDDFSPEGEEPAVMREALLQVPSFRSRAGLEDRPRQLRDYDQPGNDLHLLDSFELPRGILSGAMIFSGRGQSKLSWNDHVQVGDFDYSKWPDSTRPGIAFGGPGEVRSERLNDSGRLEGMKIIALDEFLPGGANISPGETLLGYLNRADRPASVDVEFQDDTMIDFAAFVLCLEPEEPKATTFREHRLKPIGPDISFLSCSGDPMQPECNANSGDISCRVAAPVMCYREGERFTEEQLEKLDQTIWDGSFAVGGEVRQSRPAIPAQFATLDQANAFCAAEFGKGWRVLSFHESGGYAVASRSDIPAEARGIVAVTDSPYGNCWDRPESVRGE